MPQTQTTNFKGVTPPNASFASFGRRNSIPISRENKICHDQQRMRDFATVDLYRYIDITSNTNACSADSDDVGDRFLELSNQGPAWQEFVHSSG